MTLKIFQVFVVAWSLATHRTDIKWNRLYRICVDHLSQDLRRSDVLIICLHDILNSLVEVCLLFVGTVFHWFKYRMRVMIYPFDFKFPHLIDLHLGDVLSPSDNCCKIYKFKLKVGIKWSLRLESATNRFHFVANKPPVNRFDLQINCALFSTLEFPTSNTQPGNTLSLLW